MKKRPGFSLPATALALGGASVLLVSWLNWQNRLDLDHQAYAAADAISVLAAALDHYAHLELQRAVPVNSDTQRVLSASEIAAFRTHSVTPPWMNPAYDDLTGFWDLHYLVHYPAGSIHPWAILNLEPRGHTPPQLVNRIRNQLAGRFPALVSGGTSSVRDSFTGNVRVLSGTIRGSALAAEDMAFFTWPMADINPNWLPREERAGVASGVMSTDLDFAGSHHVTGLGTMTTDTMEARGDLVSGSATRTVLEDIVVAGNGLVIDLTVSGDGSVAGRQTLTDMTSQDLLDIGNLRAQSTLEALRGVVDEADIEGALSVVGNLTTAGTSFVVAGDVQVSNGFGRTLDDDMNLAFDALEVRGFLQVDDDATIETVTITGTGACIGCQFSAF